MERKFYKTMEAWNNMGEDKMPMLVIGARQVGKTYIINEFCQNNFTNYCYINLFEDKKLIDWFSNLDTFDKKIEILQMTYNINLKDENTILFVDEVQESDDFIEALKTFCERGYTNIICAGSLLGVKLKRFKKSYPVGKVYEEYMYPMDFEEFLIATGRSRYIEPIRKCFQDNTECLYHTELMEQFYRFLYLGGMPKIIKNYIDCNEHLNEVNTKLISNIISSYKNDINKYNTDNKESIRIERIYDNIPGQLAKENQKFIFAKIDKKDNRKRDYITALDWLISCNLVLPSYAVTKVESPLQAYICEDSFKLFLSDTKIICSMLDINGVDIITNDNFDFKEVLAENYVATELVKNGIKLFYWTRKSNHEGNAEVDFVIEAHNKIIPIEVKAGTDMKSKSLEVYNKLYNPELMIKISAKNFGLKNNIKTIPLYSVFCLKDMIE